MQLCLLDYDNDQYSTSTFIFLLFHQI